tara:strand:+ start:405 stop:665 length:261 start_codon:yes stop_codon:yes gene_type:complete
MQVKWLGVKEASNNLGISQATLWNLKNNLSLDAGKHWIYVTGKKNSNVLFNIETIREWQIAETIANEEEPIRAAKKIASYTSRVGV